jgi:hypothetical protein
MGLFFLSIFTIEIILNVIGIRLRLLLQNNTASSAPAPALTVLFGMKRKFDMLLLSCFPFTFSGPFYPQITLMGLKAGRELKGGNYHKQ